MRNSKLYGISEDIFINTINNLRKMIGDFVILDKNSIHHVDPDDTIDRTLVNLGTRLRPELVEIKLRLSPKILWYSFQYLSH